MTPKYKIRTYVLVVYLGHAAFYEDETRYIEFVQMLINVEILVLLCALRLGEFCVSVLSDRFALDRFKYRHELQKLSVFRTCFEFRKFFCSTFSFKALCLPKYQNPWPPLQTIHF